MFDQVALWLEQYPYLGAAILFLLCGLGLPLPEEIVLLAAGYVCAKWPQNASLWLMMVCSGGAIMVGDLIPFVLGRVFGTRLLRLRWMRILVTKRRLAMFDRWFRRRGDMVILIARFIAGLRVVAFFTAGVMKMPWRRFLLLDGLGILLIVPLLIWLGYHSQAFIDDLIENVQRVERGLLWGIVGGGAVVAGWYWFWRRGRRAARRRATGEAFVQPSRPIAHESEDGEPVPATDATPPEPDADAAAGPGLDDQGPEEHPRPAPVDASPESPGPPGAPGAPGAPGPKAPDDPVPPASEPR